MLLSFSAMFPQKMIVNNMENNTYLMHLIHSA